MPSPTTSKTRTRTTASQPAVKSRSAADTPTLDYKTKTSKLPKAIVDADEYTESQNWLLYGDSGIGKTVAAAQLPNVLIVAADPGTVSAARFNGEANGIRKVWPVRSFADFEEVYNYLYEDDHPFDWVVVDSLTRARELAMWHTSSKRADDAAKKQKENTDPYAPELRDYLVTQEKIKYLVTDWNALPVNVFWIATAMLVENQNGDEILMPLIPGKNYEVSQYICSDMHVVAHYAFVKAKTKDGEVETARRIIFQPSGTAFAKNRYDTRRRDGSVLKYLDIARGDRQIMTMDQIVKGVYEQYGKREGA